MKVSVIVATYGRREWALRGSMAADSAVGAHEVIALHENDGTLAGVRNLAAAAASGDWLCFLDADDRLGDGYLAAMDAAGLDAATRILDRWAEDGISTSPVPPPLLFVPALSFVSPDGVCTDPVIPAWDRSIYDVNCAVIGTLVPRLLFARVGGFSDEWSAYEDWELWLRCIAAGALLVPVSDAVYCARAEDGTGRNTEADHGQTYRDIRDRHAGVAPTVWSGAKQ